MSSAGRPNLMRTKNNKTVSKVGLCQYAIFVFSIVPAGRLSSAYANISVWP